MTISPVEGVFAEMDALSERQSKAVAQRLREDDSIRSVLATKQGRAVMSWILNLTHVHESTFATDAITLAALAAQRDIGLVVLARLEEVDYENVLLMTKESREDGND